MEKEKIISLERLTQFYGNLKTWLSGIYSTKDEVDTALSGKQDTISDLSDIRSGAASGATAYQKPSSGIPNTDMSSSVQETLSKADIIPGGATATSSLTCTGTDTYAWSSWEGSTHTIPVEDHVMIDGRSYPVVKIGSQLWMAENLDYKWTGLTIGADESEPTTPCAWYYDNDEETYGVDGNRYGLLYNWYAYKYLDDNRSTMLPDGWRVPSIEDLEELGGSSEVNGKLYPLGVVGWGSCTNTTGMSLVPAGYRTRDGFSNNSTFLSTRTPHPDYPGKGAYIYINNNTFPYIDNTIKTFAYPVRLVKHL